MTLEQLFAGRLIDIPAVLANLKRTAEQIGLAFKEHTMTFNSRPAQELGKWAEIHGKGDEYRQSVFHACFAEGANIGKVAVLVKLVEALGLDGEAAEQALSKGTFSPEVDRDWSYSRSCGITAVPTFQANGRKVVGAQPYEALVELLTDA